MHCPKCTGETKGTLRVCQEVPPTVLNDEGVVVTCDQNFHWFALPLSVLKGTNAIQETDLQNEEGMETASNVLQQFAVPTPMDILALHRMKAGGWPSIEEYRERMKVAAPKRLRILLVDDEAQNRTALTMAIMDNVNADVIPATNGGEAVELFQMHSPFDLVITDYNMPVLNGLEAAQAMLKMNPDQRIILMSGNAEVAKQIDNPRIIFRYKLSSAKDFMKLIQQLCK